ncbi:hypothetical protein NPIL_291941, partial [Nephila pilipes]
MKSQAPSTTPLPPPIMMKITTNYRDQLKTLTLDYPNLRTRLSGDYVKLYLNTDDEYRSIIKSLEEHN